MTHPHPGKRSPWISCKTPPTIPGIYQYGSPLDYDYVRWDGEDWSCNGILFFVYEHDQWRGLAEEPK